MTRTILLLTVALAAPALYAETDIHIGIGTQSCGNWLRARADARDGTTSLDRDTAILLSNMMVSWVQGFAVATAMALDVTTNRIDDMPAFRRLPDANSVNAWVDKYCREQPLKSVMDAAIQLTRTLNVR